jgi:hypothetical protein
MWKKIVRSVVLSRLVGTPVSSTDKNDPHDITEILLKVALSTINQPNQSKWWIKYDSRQVKF